MAVTRAVGRVATQFLQPSAHSRLAFCSDPFIPAASLPFVRSKMKTALREVLYTANDDQPPGLSNLRIVPESTINAMIQEVYGELEVQTREGEGGAARVRQHTNPLKKSLTGPYYPPVWAMVFTNPKLPLIIDIGSGSGRFLMLQAKKNGGSSNFLGLDVRHKLVDRSNAWAQQLQLKNIHFITANATIALDSLLATYPGKLTFVSILCPDPQFKSRHYKRRIVQRPLVDAIMKYLAIGGKLFLESDVEEVVLDMKRHFKGHLGSSLLLLRKHDMLAKEQEWYPENPTGIATEREIAVIARGLPMYRLLYERVVEE